MYFYYKNEQLQVEFYKYIWEYVTVRDLPKDRIIKSKFQVVFQFHS